MATTRLDAPVRRELDIEGDAYTLTITPQHMTLVRKGRRKGFELEWAQLVSGEAALATALNASLTANLRASPTPARTRSKTAKR
jgi:hypothetical protein